MSKIEINVAIDATNLDHVEAACVFMKSIGGSTEVPKKETPKKTDTKKTETKKTEKVDEGIKIEDVRALLAKKVNDHRDAIKEKLTEFEANNVTALKKEKYQEVMDFLNKLK